MSEIDKTTDYRGLVEEFKKESDRAAVIVGAAFLDERLREVIADLLVDDEKEVRKLFEPMGSLGSFGARIRMAYCLGLLRKEDFHDLGVIQKIRNRFAHELHGLSFADAKITQQCRQLKAPQETLSAESVQSYSPRNLFLFTLAGLNAALSATKFFTTANDRRCVVPTDRYKR